MIIPKNLILKNLKKFLAAFIFAAGLLIGGALVYFQKEKTGNFLTLEQAGEKAINFINQAIQEDVTASLTDVSETSGVYKIHLQIEGKEYDSYMSKDGKLLFSSAFGLEEKPEETK